MIMKVPRANKASRRAWMEVGEKAQRSMPSSGVVLSHGEWVHGGGDS